MMNPVTTDMFYVYILHSRKNKRLYTGYTSNPRKRFAEHQAGRSTYTKDRGPYDLLYYEACLSADDTVSREKDLKSGMAKRYIKNRNKCFLAEESDESC